MVTVSVMGRIMCPPDMLEPQPLGMCVNFSGETVAAAVVG